MNFRKIAFNNYYEYYFSHSINYSDINKNIEDLDDEQNVRYKQLIKYATEHIDSIVLYIDDNTSNWSFDRIKSVEKICLILGVAELSMKLTKKEIVIAEWVKLTDELSSSDGAKFVNGILDKIHTELST